MTMAGLRGSIKYLTFHADRAERPQTKGNREKAQSASRLPVYYACVARAPGDQESGESFQMGWRRGWTGDAEYFFCAHRTHLFQRIPY